MRNKWYKVASARPRDSLGRQEQAGPKPPKFPAESGGRHVGRASAATPHESDSTAGEYKCRPPGGARSRVGAANTERAAVAGLGGRPQLFWLHRLLGQELRLGEQRLRRLRDLVIVSISLTAIASFLTFTLFQPALDPCSSGVPSDSSPSLSRPTTPPLASSLRPSSRAGTNSTARIWLRGSPHRMWPVTTPVQCNRPGAPRPATMLSSFPILGLRCPIRYQALSSIQPSYFRMSLFRPVILSDVEFLLDCRV